LDLIGRGTEAIVWRAEYAGAPVAVKELLVAPGGGSEEGGDECAELEMNMDSREASILMQLRHQHIVRFFGLSLSPTSDRLCLVLELCVGTLSELLWGSGTGAVEEGGASGSSGSSGGEGRSRGKKGKKGSREKREEKQSKRDKREMREKRQRRRHPSKQAFSAETCCTYLVQISSAMQHLHEHGVLHRDLKADNGDTSVCSIRL
jgi:serine/threonine protein kinase